MNFYREQEKKVLPFHCSSSSQKINEVLRRIHWRYKMLCQRSSPKAYNIHQITTVQITMRLVLVLPQMQYRQKATENGKYEKFIFTSSFMFLNTSFYTLPFQNGM